MHWHPTPVLSPGKSHGQRSLVGYSPWGFKELDTTERLHVHVHDAMNEVISFPQEGEMIHEHMGLEG